MLSSAFLSATNHLLAQSKWARERLQPHAGRTARLTFAPIADIDFSISAEGHLAEWSAADEPDVCLCLAAGSLPQMLLGGVENAMRHVRIEGNAELADAIGFVFRHLRWDAEEDLSRIVGDIAAHRLFDSGRALSAETRRSVERAGANFAEYLTEESPMLVSRHALPGFAQEVTTLRDDLARMEKRVERLLRRR